jgi:small-conductance mechanosensitive channel
MTACRARFLTLVLVALLAQTSALRAQDRPDPAGSDAAPATNRVTVSDPEATLVVSNRPVVTFRASYFTRTPRRRATLAEERIDKLPDEALTGTVVAVPAFYRSIRGVMLEVADFPVFGLVEEDVDPESGESFDVFVTRAVENLKAALRARAEQEEGRILLRGIAVSVPAVLAFLVFVWLLVRAQRFVTRWAAAVSARRLQKMSHMGFDLWRQSALLARIVVDSLAWALGLIATYLCLTFVFVQFPYTEPWGSRLGEFLRETVEGLLEGLAKAVPGVVVVAFIFLITRIVASFVTTFFRNVERGGVRVGWFDPHTARATRRIVVVLLWLFALVAAYPHIPGSHSEAFRGISVLVGLVVSLGSTGLVNQVMSGFVVVYSRALKPGDWVRVGEVEGLVEEVGMLTTKLKTVRREEVNIPNAVLVGTTTTNFTSLAGADGPLVSTTVTIGYDAPWRQVHALLTQAASRTQGVRQRPEPRVLQRGLSDFYVEYQLIAHLERAEDRFEVLSRLHAQIQDAFNEQGVQIMSPHFAVQPGGSVVVPKSKWFAAPAAPEKEERGAP